MLRDNFTLNGSLKIYVDLLNLHLRTRQAVYRLDLYWHLGPHPDEITPLLH